MMIFKCQVTNSNNNNNNNINELYIYVFICLYIHVYYYHSWQNNDSIYINIYYFSNVILVDVGNELLISLVKSSI